MKDLRLETDATVHDIVVMSKFHVLPRKKSASGKYVIQIYIYYLLIFIMVLLGEDRG